jgi:hypothetical protein
MTAMRGQNVRQFFKGLALGSIALVLLWGISLLGALLSRGSSSPYSSPLLSLGVLSLLCSGTALLVQVVTALVWLTQPQRRIAAYGLLAASLVSVAVAQQGCLLIFQFSYV